jgi:hypothetical protein
VVIIGFSRLGIKPKVLFNGEIRNEVSRINAYLIDAPDVFLLPRSAPLCSVPTMIYGSEPRDGGHLIIEKGDYEDFLIQEPEAMKYIRRYTGADEFLNNHPRYCLWLVGVNPIELQKLPHVLKRIERTRDFRLTCKRSGTIAAAEMPSLFESIRQPSSDYIIVPIVSSERRRYLPLGFVQSDLIVNNAVQVIPNASLYHFGVLTSQVHNAWMRVVAGRLKSDYRYSNTIVYNNFMWPNPSDVQKTKIEMLAQAVLDAREKYPDATLAQMYDPDKDYLFPELTKAHKELDKAVEEAYGVKFNGNEEKIVAHLFKLYADATS